MNPRAGSDVAHTHAGADVVDLLTNLLEPRRCLVPSVVRDLTQRGKNVGHAALEQHGIARRRPDEGQQPKECGNCRPGVRPTPLARGRLPLA